jgi:hypothetical protein
MHNLIKYYVRRIYGENYTIHMYEIGNIVQYCLRMFLFSYQHLTEVTYCI